MYIGQILVTVDSSTWSPVTVPPDARTGTSFNAKRIVFSNNETGALDVNRRIVSTDPDTQLLIPSGMQAVWQTSEDSKGFSGFSLSSTGSGVVVAYLKSVSGSFDVLVEFIG